MIKSDRYIHSAFVLSILGLVYFGLGASAQAATKIKAGTTLAHLHVAYNGESNAHARYLAFAKRAEEEGLGKIACLFRAAARAEQVHLNHYAEVIRKMGGKPEAILHAAKVRSTRENLRASAMKGEAYERDTMYPEFIKQANAEGNSEAARTFELARVAEAEHFRLFFSAFANLASMKGAGQTYYVCPVCGFTSAEPVKGACASCMASGENYEPVT